MVGILEYFQVVLKMMNGTPAHTINIDRFHKNYCYARILIVNIKSMSSVFVWFLELRFYDLSRHYRYGTCESDMLLP